MVTQTKDAHMIKCGLPPYLECSSRGDKRFSALYARICSRNFNSIEEIYQSAKRFPPGPDVDMFGQLTDWRKAKGKLPINLTEVVQLYETLWREYLAQSPDLIHTLVKASGLSDMFGQPGHQCQAEILWKLRNEYIQSRG